MGDLRAGDRPAAAATASANYRAELLREVRLVADGLVHRAPPGERSLRWADVSFAVAAEIGEPEGVRTVVFDLVLGREAGAWHAARIAAEPGPAAEELARAIHAGVGPARRGPSIKSLALDGLTSWWYPDLESFEAAIAAALPKS